MPGLPFVRSHRAGLAFRRFSPPRVFGSPLTRHTVLGCVGMIRPRVQRPSSPYHLRNFRSSSSALTHSVQIPADSPPLPPTGPGKNFPCNLTSLIARKILPGVGGEEKGGAKGGTNLLRPSTFLRSLLGPTHSGRPSPRSNDHRSRRRFWLKPPGSSHRYSHSFFSHPDPPFSAFHTPVKFRGDS